MSSAGHALSWRLAARPDAGLLPYLMTFGLELGTDSPTPILVGVDGSAHAVTG